MNMKIGTEADSLADQWTELQKEKFVLSEKERVLIEEINEFAGNETKTRGVINVEGDENVIKITRRENVKYEKDGDTDVLIRALRTIDGFEEYVSLSVREKGTRLTKIFEVPEDSRSEVETEMVKSIEEFRVVTQGKPSVSVAPRKR